MYLFDADLSNVPTHYWTLIAAWVAGVIINLLVMTREWNDEVHPIWISIFWFIYWPVMIFLGGTILIIGFVCYLLFVFEDPNSNGYDEQYPADPPRT